MRKFIFSGSLLGALFGAIGAIRATIRGPRDWRVGLIWGGWLITVVLAVANIVMEESDEEKREIEARQRELLIHIGPHKTGTKSIQYFIGDIAKLLEKHGTYAPPSLGDWPRGTVHHVAYEILGLSFANLGLDITSINLDSSLAEWLAGAKAANCSRIIVSAEDFSQMGVAGWKRFQKSLQHAMKRTATEVTHITLHWTDRPAQQVYSSYVNELYKAGSFLSEEEAIAGIAVNVEKPIASLSEAPEALTIITTTDRFDFSGQSGSAPFLKRWSAQVFGTRVTSRVPRKTFSIHRNVQLRESSQIALREFNQLNTPSHLPAFTPFANVSSNEADIAARERLFLFRKAIMQREEAWNELDEIRSSLAYRTLNQLGRIKRIFRRHR